MSKAIYPLFFEGGHKKYNTNLFRNVNRPRSRTARQWPQSGAVQTPASCRGSWVGRGPSDRTWSHGCAYAGDPEGVCCGMGL
ncbi:hypothetical protein DPMN_032785 [Dreissena polymorpha]|uniref:Uncharacterized protein n=1 Tax=Dreissena polymorpha TaxID=45954 RepID=A0A9D4M4U9_DREPO|nr:hypothetical protein DPMN_032785 [Dreissena polymorpha]